MPTWYRVVKEGYQPSGLGQGPLDDTCLMPATALLVAHLQPIIDAQLQGMGEAWNASKLPMLAAGLHVGSIVSADGCDADLLDGFRDLLPCVAVLEHPCGKHLGPLLPLSSDVLSCQGDVAFLSITGPQVCGEAH